MEYHDKRLEKHIIEKQQEIEKFKTELETARQNMEKALFERGEYTPMKFLEMLRGMPITRIALIVRADPKKPAELRVLTDKDPSTTLCISDNGKLAYSNTETGDAILTEETSGRQMLLTNREDGSYELSFIAGYVSLTVSSRHMNITT